MAITARNQPQRRLERLTGHTTPIAKSSTAEMRKRAGRLIAGFGCRGSYGEA